MMKNRQQEQIWGRSLSSTRTNSDTLQLLSIHWSSMHWSSFFPSNHRHCWISTKKKNRFELIQGAIGRILFDVQELKNKRNERMKRKDKVLCRFCSKRSIDKTSTDWNHRLFIIVIEFVEGKFFAEVNSPEMLELESMKRLFFDVFSFSLTLFERSENEPLSFY